MRQAECKQSRQKWLLPCCQQGSQADLAVVNDVSLGQRESSQKSSQSAELFPGFVGDTICINDIMLQILLVLQLSLIILIQLSEDLFSSVEPQPYSPSGRCASIWPHHRPMYSVQDQIAARSFVSTPH